MIDVAQRENVHNGTRLDEERNCNAENENRDGNGIFRIVRNERENGLLSDHITSGQLLMVIILFYEDIDFLMFFFLE